MDVKERMKFFGHPEDFVITGRRNYRGHECYILECEPSGYTGWIRHLWYVGTKDRRFYGMLQFHKGKKDVERWTLDYREVAPGFWFPMTQGRELYEEESKDEPYLRSRQDLKVVEVRVNKQLPDKFFKIELKDGVTVGDKRSGELRTYIYESDPNKLNGRVLPDFNNISVGFRASQAVGKSIMVCFWDMDQRPSRHMLRELAKRADKLKEKGVKVVCVQASKVERGVLDKWVKENKVSFTVGMIEGDEEKVRFDWGVKSLPWLIMADTKNIVRLEGFGIEELDE